MASLRETVARLAAGSHGRTEADVQADVRGFLLQAPLELVDDQIVNVSLEAQAGQGRRIDVEAGRAAIEVKKSLASKSVREAATKTRQHRTVRLLKQLRQDLDTWRQQAPGAGGRSIARPRKRA
jgi:hypothetical protein